MKQCDAYEGLLSGYLDGELTQGDRQRVEVHMEACDECRQTYEHMTQLRNQIGGLPVGKLSSGEWDQIMHGVSIRTSRGLGWLLYLTGLVVLVAYAAIAFLRDNTIDAVIKVCVAAIVIGILLLLISVIQQRRTAAKTDIYKDVQI